MVPTQTENGFCWEFEFLSREESAVPTKNERSTGAMEVTCFHASPYVPEPRSQTPEVQISFVREKMYFVMKLIAGHAYRPRSWWQAVC